MLFNLKCINQFALVLFLGFAFCGQSLAEENLLDDLISEKVRSDIYNDIYHKDNAIINAEYREALRRQIEENENPSFFNFFSGLLSVKSGPDNRTDPLEIASLILLSLIAVFVVIPAIVRGFFKLLLTLREVAGELKAGISESMLEKMEELKHGRVKKRVGRRRLKK